MKVKATAKGFYGKFRHIGDEFEIRNEKELGSWMKVLEQPKPKKTAKPKKTLKSSKSK